MRLPSSPNNFRPNRRGFLAGVAAGAAGAFVGMPGFASAQPKKPDDKTEKKRVEEAIERGLDWLKKAQAQDGHFEAQGGAYKTAMTGLAGMAFLMEGSNLKEGKYSDQVKKAADWFMSPGRQLATGLYSDTKNPSEASSYMYGQGFGTMFLACAHGSEEDRDEQQKVEKSLKKAVEFICKAQTSKKHKRAEGKEVEVGGWGYVSAADGGNFDEGSVTITALQALRACRNAAIPVPKEAINKSVAYLEVCTTPKGGVIYSYAGGNGVAAAGQERPPITAAACACAVSSGELTGAIKIMNDKNPPTGIARPACVRWIEFCKNTIPFGKNRLSHDEYQNYYFSQVAYMLGDDRYGQLFPKEDKNAWLTWSKFKESMFPYLLDSQSKTDGSWGNNGIGAVYTSSINLTILQLENAILPLYQR